jgi:cytochrome c-type biogenesis protein
MDLTLIIPAFIAGILTFLAPCTLPLVPGYLSFISGSSSEELKNPALAHKAKLKIFLNGFFFILGFSVVFVVLGTLAGVAGAALSAYRLWLSVIGGALVIIFGLFMMGALKLMFLVRERQFQVPSFFGRGRPATSLVLGSAFGFGWTPCVGPILGSVLLLASSSATALQGAFMLSVFSAGLAVPFLLIAAGIGSASEYISKYFNFVVKYRMPILIAFGIILGILLHPLLVTPGALKFAPLSVSFSFSLLPEELPVFVKAGVVALILGLVGYFKEVDSISVVGGLFFVYLGILLLTNNMALLISYGFEALQFINYDAILDYL